MFHIPMITRRKFQKRISGLIFLLLFNTLSFASDWQMPPLEVITADNVSRLTEITKLGSGPIGVPVWSPDESVFLLGSAVGVWEYHLDDLAHPTLYLELYSVESFDERNGVTARLESGENVYLSRNLEGRLEQTPLPTLSPGSTLSADDRQLIHDLSLLHAWTPGITRIVAWSDDRRYMVIEEQIEVPNKAHLHIIDTQSRLEIAKLEAESGTFQTVGALIFMPVFDEHGLLFMRNRNLFRWDVNSQTEELLVEIGADITVSPRAHYVIRHAVTPAMHQDTTLQVWDISGDEPILLHAQLFRGTDWWDSIAFHPTRPIVATAGHNSNIRQWDISTRGTSFFEDNPPDEGGEREVLNLKYIREGRYLIGHEHPYAGAATGFIRDASIGEQIVTLFGDYNQQIASLAVDSDEQHVAFGLEDGTLVVWALDDLFAQSKINVSQSSHILKGHTAGIWRVIYSPDGRWLASTSEGGTVKLWDTTTFSMVMSRDFGANVFGLSFRPDSAALAIGSLNGGVTLISTTPAAVSLSLVTDKGAGMQRLIYSPDGTLLISAAHGWLYFWDASTGKTLDEIKVSPVSINDITFNADGTLLGLVDSRGRVRLLGVPAQ